MSAAVYSVDDIDRFDALVACLESEQIAADQWAGHCAAEPDLEVWRRGEPLLVSTGGQAPPVPVCRANG